jgi:hypothetical protein
MQFKARLAWSASLTPANSLLLHIRSIFSWGIKVHAWTYKEKHTSMCHKATIAQLCLQQHNQAGNGFNRYYDIYIMAHV